MIGSYYEIKTEEEWLYIGKLIAFGTEYEQACGIFKNEVCNLKALILNNYTFREVTRE